MTSGDGRRAGAIVESVCWLSFSGSDENGRELALSLLNAVVGNRDGGLDPLCIMLKRSCGCVGGGRQMPGLSPGSDGNGIEIFMAS